MAERRMFHAGVVESDAFLDMTPAAQALYFHLGMQADDDGFVNGPRQVCRRCGARMEELQELMDGDFLLWFDGVAVIKHWRMANNLKADRLKMPNYPEIAKKLYFGPNRIYQTSRTRGTVSVWDERAEKMKSRGIQLDPNGIQMESQKRRREKKREEKKIKENRLEEKKVEEPNTARGVELTDEEIGELCRVMGLEKTMYYSARLGKFISEHDADIKDHYDTILKWWEEDGGTYHDQ